MVISKSDYFLTASRLILLGACLFLFKDLSAELDTEKIKSVYGEGYEVINRVPGRPWVEVQYRYDLDNLMITCNFVDDRCLWLDFYKEDGKATEDFVFAQIERLFPGVEWTAKDFHGRPRWWFNSDQDRITLRARGFTLHMNEYIENVLSRRAQWQF